MDAANKQVNREYIERRYVQRKQEKRSWQSWQEWGVVEELTSSEDTFDQEGEIWVKTWKWWERDYLDIWRKRYRLRE